MSIKLKENMIKGYDKIVKLEWDVDFTATYINAPILNVEQSGIKWTDNSH